LQIAALSVVGVEEGNDMVTIDYPTVPSPTPYDVPFSHTTDDRQTDGRQSVPIA